MVKILDTTLREGEQTPGVCFDTHIKTAIADRLDAVGVDIIEAGHPAVTDQIGGAVERIAARGLNAVIGAHARSMRGDVDLALERGVGFLGIFYCVSEERLSFHEKKLSQAIDQVAATIAYARERQPDLVIRFTPEDTVRSAWTNVIDASAEAVRAGADVISIADTTGYMIPGKRSLFEYVDRLKSALARNDLHPQIAVHCHNDRGLALANALDGYRAGADIIDAAVMSLGERAGVVDLASLLAVLATDFGEAARWDLEKIPELYDLVSTYSGLVVPFNLPVTGKNVFTHCAGVHTQAALRDPLHYQSIDPHRFGRQPRIALDHMSGLSAVKYSLEGLGERDPDPELCKDVLAKVKEIGQTGRVVSGRELRCIVEYFKKERCEMDGHRRNGSGKGGSDESRVFTLAHA